MIVHEAAKGNVNLQIQDSFSALLLSSSAKLNAGTIEVSIHRENGGKTDILPKINILDVAEMSRHGVIINKTAESQVLLQVSDRGNVVLMDKDYISVKIEGLTHGDGSPTAEIRAIREFFGDTGHNVLKEFTLFAGVKSKTQSVVGYDEIMLPNVANLQSVDLVRDGNTISLDKEEIKATMRTINAKRVMVQETVTDFNYKNWFVLPIKGVDTVRIYTDGGAAVNFYLNKLA